jgi:signal transduction histidine kinase
MTSLAVLAFFIPAASAIRSAERRGQLLELQREASIVANRISSSEGGNADAVQLALDNDHRLGLYSAAGRLIGGRGPQQPDRIVQLALEGNFAEGYISDDLVAAVPVSATAEHPALVVRIESPRSTLEDRFRRSVILLALAGVAIVGTAAAVAAWVARRLNRPVEQLTAWAGEQSDVSAAPELTGIAELDELRDALLDDRARIAELLQRERSFSAQVSHQLRTPVAAMRVAVETELEAPRPDATAVLHETVEQLERLESTITSLLALARHTERTVVECDLFDVVSRRLEAWRRHTERAGRSIVVDGSSFSAHVDEDAIGHTLDVLVDNALRHGRGSITVTVASTDTGATIDVADEGPAPRDRDPFAELGSDSSHGIGLRLARALAESSGGRLVLRDRQTTTFRLTIPR